MDPARGLGRRAEEGRSAPPVIGSVSRQPGPDAGDWEGAGCVDSKRWSQFAGLFVLLVGCNMNQLPAEAQIPARTRAAWEVGFHEPTTASFQAERHGASCRNAEGGSVAGRREFLVNC